MNCTKFSRKPIISKTFHLKYITVYENCGWMVNISNRGRQLCSRECGITNTFNSGPNNKSAIVYVWAKGPFRWRLQTPKASEMKSWKREQWSGSHAKKIYCTSKDLPWPIISLFLYMYIYIAWNRGYIQAVPTIKTERTNIPWRVDFNSILPYSSPKVYRTIAALKLHVWFKLSPKGFEEFMIQIKFVRIRSNAPPLRHCSK